MRARQGEGRAALFPVGEPKQNPVMGPSQFCTAVQNSECAVEPERIVEKTGTQPDVRRESRDHLLAVVRPVPVGEYVYVGVLNVANQVLGVQGRSGTPRAYPFKALGEQAALNETLDGGPVLIVWQRDGQYAAPFIRIADRRTLTFDIVTQ